MLAELKLYLQSDAEISYYQSSNLQGILMEQIDSDYADRLHTQGINPYSQYLIGRDEKIWIITAATREAYEKILLPLYQSTFTDFRIEKKNVNVAIAKKELSTKPRQELLDYFYGKQSEHTVTLELLTPTAFKSGGHYVIMPDTRLLFQSLMNKYSASSDDLESFDEETLEELVSHSFISQYRLRSTQFPLEGIRIPAFIGEFTVRLTGNETLTKYADMLLQFGEYSGVGIKTAMGMGAMKIIDRRHRND